MILCQLYFFHHQVMMKFTSHHTAIDMVLSSYPPENKQTGLLMFLKNKLKSVFFNTRYLNNKITIILLYMNDLQQKAICIGSTVSMPWIKCLYIHVSCITRINICYSITVNQFLCYLPIVKSHRNHSLAAFDFPHF